MVKHSGAHYHPSPSKPTSHSEIHLKTQHPLSAGSYQEHYKKHEGGEYSSHLGDDSSVSYQFDKGDSTKYGYEDEDEEKLKVSKLHGLHPAISNIQLHPVGFGDLSKGKGDLKYFAPDLNRFIPLALPLVKMVEIGLMDYKHPNRRYPIQQYYDPDRLHQHQNGLLLTMLL